MQRQQRTADNIEFKDLKRMPAQTGDLASQETDGVDMSLIELNLSKTHWERLMAHQRSLELVRILQRAKKTPHGKPQ